jgi:hypothetical protein
MRRFKGRWWSLLMMDANLHKQLVGQSQKGKVSEACGPERASMFWQLLIGCSRLYSRAEVGSIYQTTRSFVLFVLAIVSISS